MNRLQRIIILLWAVALLLVILGPICLYSAGEKEYANFVLNNITGIGVFLAVVITRTLITVKG